MSELIYNWLNNEVGMYPHITDFKEDFYNGYKFGNLLFKLCLISLDEFLQNYFDANDYFSRITNYNNLMKHLKNSCGLELTPNMIQPIFEKQLTAAMNLIYKIRVAVNKKKINFDQIRTFDIYADFEEIKKRFEDMASFNIEAITGKEDEKANEIILFNKNDSQKKIKKITFYDQLNKKTKNKTSELDNNNNENNDEELFKLTKSEKLNPIRTKNHFRLQKYNNHKRDINYMLNTNIDLENKEELKERFDANLFKENLHIIGFNINSEKLKFLNGSLNVDMTQDTIMKKVREQLKERIVLKKQKDLSIQNLEKSNIENPSSSSTSRKNTYQNFFNKEFTLFKLNNKKDIVNNSCTNRRFNYDYNQRENAKHKDLEKRINLFKTLMSKNNEKNKKLNKSKILFQINTPEKTFEKMSYFTELNKTDLKKSIIKAEIRKNNIIHDYPLIKKIVYQIIDYTYEGYIYQQENKKDLIDLIEYKDWNHRFVKGKPIKEPILDKEGYEMKKLYSVIGNKEKVIWTIENEREVLDYINYAGEWDDRFIIPIHERGKSIEFKDIYHNLSDDFEPTYSQIEDVIMPKLPVRNYKFSNLIMNVLEYKFPNKKRNLDIKGKWDYIPIKIAFIGFPLAGKKTQADIIYNKFNGIKIISVYDIINNKVKEWNEINEPIENHPKFKTLKENQINEMKEEQNKKIEDFKLNNSIIIEYLEDENENKIPSDELLFKYLVEKIENEFPIKTESEVNKELIERQKKLKELTEKLQTLKKENEESNKPNIKDEQNLEKEIETISNETYKGFILVDYPKNINQCILLEKYLTNYIDPSSIPKPLKEVELDLLSNILDIKYKPKEDNSIRKGGLDFIINLNVNEDIINERYNNCKYDPVTGKIYNENEINNNGKINIDKKIYDRLESEIPEFKGEKFNNLKKEYNDNLNKIERFYSKFGFVFEKNDSGKEKKENIYLFQKIDNTENKEEISNYINENLLKTIHIENDKREKKIFIEIENDDENEEKEKIHIEKLKFHLSTLKKEKEKEKEMFLIVDSSEYIYREIINFNDRYRNYLKQFIFFIDKQYDDLCKRFNLLQRRFEQFLGIPTDKRKLIKVFINKYNSFRKKYPHISNTEVVVNEFKNDIEDLNNKLWLYVRQKETECIIELNEIFASKYFENEMKKFYFQILDIFKIEAEKFIISLNIIFKIFGKKPEDENLNDNDIYNKNSNENKFNSEIIFEKIPQCLKHETLEFYSKNIKKIFLNCIKLILDQEEEIKNLEKHIKATTSNLNESMITKHRKKGDLALSTHSKFQMEESTEEKVKKMIRKEKLKFKYRILVLKYYSLSYLERLQYTSDRVHNNMDSWIIVSVRLQNIAMQNVKETLLKHIENVKEIPNDLFDNFHMDQFSTSYEIYHQINYEHILGSKKRESRFLLDFNYDVVSLHNHYNDLKKFNVENNVIPFNVFKEMFIKEIWFGRENFDKKNFIDCISQPLKFLSYKKVMNFIDKFKFNYDNEEKDKFNLEKEYKEIIEKEKVFEEYVNYGGIFSVLSIVGSKVLDNEIYEKINSDFNEKIIRGHFIKKDDFLNYKFWFEDDDYLKDKIENVKLFLFDIWKDEKEELFNLKEFLYSIGIEKLEGKLLKDRIIRIDYYNFAFY